jgi:hypothetical protein
MKRAVASSLSLSLAALGGACLPDRPIAKVNELCREEMAPSVYHHACQHGQLGPYEPVDAVALRDSVLPTVGGGQRVLDIKLPSLDAESVSYVRYAATRDGQHAVFAGADYLAVPVKLYRDGAVAAATPIEPVPDPVACGGMVEVTGFELTAGEAYVLELGPTRAPRMRMFIEHLPTFSETWSDRCVD